jgi:hypothetical protein
MAFANHKQSLLALVFVILAILTCLVMLVFVAMTFRRRSGLYFWSFVGLTISQTCYNIGLLLEFWVVSKPHFWVVWVFLVPGYAFFPLFEDLVFYSRLSLLTANRTTLRWVLAVGVCEVLFVEIPMAIITVGNMYLPESGFPAAFDIFWRVEACAYVAADMGFCIVYIVHVRKMWGADTDRKTKSILKYILFLAVSIMFLNVAYVTAAFVTTSPLVVCIDVSTLRRSDIQTLIAN